MALTGLSAWLYGQSHTKPEVSSFLLKITLKTSGFYKDLFEATE